VGAGTTVIREKVRPWARGIFRRMAPFAVHTGVAVKDADGHFRGFSNKTTRVTR
jgi:hypothetical protein